MTLPIQNIDVAAIFKRMAYLLDIGDANAFRVRAYRLRGRSCAASNSGIVKGSRNFFAVS
jgi:DNA polymerase/3'-5' exonuclease PolX